MICNRTESTGFTLDSTCESKRHTKRFEKKEKSVGSVMRKANSLLWKMFLYRGPLQGAKFASTERSLLVNGRGNSVNSV